MAEGPPPFLQDPPVFETVETAEVGRGDLAVEPDAAHREGFGLEVDGIHVPDDDGQESQDGLVAVDDDEHLWSQRGKTVRDSPGIHMKNPVRIMIADPQSRDQYSNFSTKLYRPNSGLSSNRQDGCRSKKPRKGFRLRRKAARPEL
jgi:hypothetical protein